MLLVRVRSLSVCIATISHLLTIHSCPYATLSHLLVNESNCVICTVFKHNRFTPSVLWARVPAHGRNGIAACGTKAGGDTIMIMILLAGATKSEV